MLCNCSTMNYNALEISLTKRYSRHFSVLSNFTWSKELGDYSQFPAAYRDLDYGVGGHSKAPPLTTSALPFGMWPRSSGYRLVLESASGLVRAEWKKHSWQVGS
jgi:hypothetical protein